MPIRAKSAVGCLALALAYCASPLAASAQNSPAASGSSDDAAKQRVSSGRTVRTELEYLTSRQTADPRKASLEDDGQYAEGEVASAPIPSRATAARAARTSKEPAAPVAVKANSSGNAERSVSSSLSKGKSDRSSSRSRKNAHKSSKWSMAFLFSGLRDAIVSGRVQYLPLLGSAPVRFKESGEFDRSHIIGFRQYDERMEELSFKAKHDDDEAGGASGDGGKDDDGKPSGVTDANSFAAGAASGNDAGVASSAAVAVATSGTGSPDSEVTSARSDPKVATSSSASASNVDYVPVSSEMVLKYFNNSTPGAEVKVGMPFVMPYQSEQPLIMDSSAKYSQTEGGTQNGTSAK